MNDYWFVIFNPTSGNGKSKKYISKIINTLNKEKINFQYAITEYANHEFEIALGQIKKGFKKFISVGGDGTLHNIINGIFNQTIIATSEIKIAVIPVGTGNDWIKNYGISKNISKNIATIKQENTTTQDIGKITFTKDNSVVYFNNLAGIGFDGHVVNSINKYKKLGSLSYLIGVFTGFSTYKSKELKIEFNNLEIKVNSLMTLIGLCKYSGGGMQLTNNSNPNDGLFDITIIKHLSLGVVLLNILKLFNGKIVNHSKVETYKTKEISVSIKDASLPFIQADGELIQSGNFNVYLLPLAIQFVIPKKMLNIS
ncbi:MAG: diacylglycerol kinase family lipid kinase [Urechidicola sp.]|nr:diacylglycerol kinase family lipid kinase [Urechidicola sp.]